MIFIPNEMARFVGRFSVRIGILARKCRRSIQSGLVLALLGIGASFAAPIPGSGITIITHGFKLTGSYLPLWAWTMAEAIRERQGYTTPIYRLRYDKGPTEHPSDDRIQLCESLVNSCADRTTPLNISQTGGAILLLDWAAASNETAGYPTQDVADLFFSFLFDQIHGNRELVQLPLHFIGHSRGTSLNSRLIYRLAERGVLVDQVTTLDPHPVQPPLGNDWVPQTFANVIFADNYYQLNDAPEGMAIDGAYGENLSSDLSGFANEHQLVHTYYHGTVDVNASSDGDEAIDPSWYYLLSTRDGTGYNYSRFGDLDRFRPASGDSDLASGLPGRGSRIPVSVGSDLWPNIWLDQRRPVRSSVYVGEPVRLPYFFAARGSGQKVTFILDDDPNPYNGAVATLGTVSHPARLDNSIGYSEFMWTPEPSHAGTRYVGVVTSSEQDWTKVRYDYYLRPIKVWSALAQPPSIQSMSPVPILTSNVPQTVTITGSNFTSASRLIFTFPDGTPSPLRTPTLETSGQLRYDGEFKVAGAWSVTVDDNESGTSEPFGFQVWPNVQAIAPPAWVTASDGTFTSGILVNWAPVQGASRYELWRATSSTGAKSPVTSSVTFTTYADVQVVADRTYYYWVKACSSAGSCSDFSAWDAGFVGQVTSGPVNVPISPNPAHGETNVSIKIGDLAWMNGGGANSYDVYFGTDSTPDSGEFVRWTPSTQTSIPDLAYSTNYYWRVDAKANGETVQGQVWQFTTRAQSVGEIPNRAINPTPVHYAEDVPLNTYLSWSDGGGATSYDVYFGRQFNPGVEEFVGNTMATTWPLPTLEHGQIYYWRIKARNAAGAAHGDIWRFRTEPPIPDPVDWPYPGHGLTDVSVNSMNLHWNDLSGNAKSFDVYFGTDPSPDAGEFKANTIQNSWQTPSLLPNTTYYWQIVSRNNAGATYGPVWSFTTWATSPGILDVALGGLSSMGPQGGAFEPSSRSYTVRNVGQQALDFSVSNTHPWLQLSRTSGALLPGEQVVVVASIAPGASSLATGYHVDSIAFRNNSDFRGSTDRAVSLAVGVQPRPQDIAEIEGGFSSVFTISSDGSLHGWGLNQYGELGLGVPTPAIVPAAVRLGMRTDWAKVSQSYRFSLALSTDGRLYAWGDNVAGQLGQGDTVARAVPTQVGTDTDWVQVSAGAAHSLALKADGRLFAFGLNGDGQLGLGDYVNRLVPTQVGVDTDWATVHAGYYKVVAIKRDGRMFTWGTKAGADGRNVQLPTQVGSLSDWAMASGGQSHLLALRRNGTLYAWGSDNSNGELGTGDLTRRNTPTQIGSDSDWVALDAGGDHSLAMKANGGVYAWGWNAYGQVGTGDKTDRLTPTLIFVDPNIRKVFATYGSSHALMEDGRLFSWGMNYYGGLGVGHTWAGTTPHLLVPTEVDLDWALIHVVSRTSLPSAGGAVNCQANSVPQGGSTTCVAIPNAGYVFSGFGGDCSGSTCTLVDVRSPVSITATFTPVLYALTATARPVEGGAVSCSPSLVGHGSMAICTATAAWGYRFDGFSGDCSGASCTLTDITSGRSVAGNFALDLSLDWDGDGIPDAIEGSAGRNPMVRDNDIFSPGTTPARLFAMQMYRDFLNREGDAAGIQGWADVVANGSWTRLQVIDAFLQSQEFAGFVSPVVRLYFATYLRVPDYDGLTFNAGLVRNGTVTLQQLADFFTASPEFAALYGSLDNPAFVTLLYGNVLGRAPDPAGLSGWVALLNGGYTRGQVLLGFSDSTEYQNAVANEVFVTMMYAGMLRRTPEPSGFTGWVNFLDAGTYTREQVINGFYLSTEYRARFLP